MGRVVTWVELETALKRERSQSRRIVFTNGCFDILHTGHIRYLQEARRLGDVLVIGVNADASVKRLKGNQRPIQNEEDRAEILAALECVSYACIFEEDTPQKLIESVRPEVLVKGGDWSADRIVGAPFVMSYGGVVRSLPFVSGRSTTGIVEKILKL